MNGARSPRDARMQAHHAALAAIEGPSLEEDVRRVVPAWGELLDLVEGAATRGWTEEQIDYLRAVVGITWAKGYHKGRSER